MMNSTRSDIGDTCRDFSLLFSSQRAHNFRTLQLPSLKNKIRKNRKLFEILVARNEQATGEAVGGWAHFRVARGEFFHVPSCHVYCSVMVCRCL